MSPMVIENICKVCICKVCKRLAYRVYIKTFKNQLKKKKPNSIKKAKVLDSPPKKINGWKTSA